ncbi:MAG: hypothetical protein MJ228_02995 [Bacilli bacterium]|nr:hypothetical protein [Bacilli bacterium]
MEKTYDEKYNELLFGIDYQSDYSEEEVENAASVAEKLIDDLGEETVFEGWFQFLLERVSDKKSARNFMFAFYNFGGQDFKISDPYPFLAALFTKVGLSIENGPVAEDEDTFDTFDSIYISMLSNTGIISDEDYFEANLFKDERLLRAIAEFKNKK